MVNILLCNAYEPEYLGTRIIANYLKKHGYSVHNVLINDFKYQEITFPVEHHQGYQAFSNGSLMVNKATFFPITDKDIKLLEDVICDYSPDIIGFSARSTNNWLVPILVPAFKRVSPKSLLVAGGFGPTLEPKIYLDNGFDCVVQCDGEEAMLDIARLYEKKEKFELFNIKNTIWKDKNGVIKYNEIRPQTKDLSKYGEPLHGDEYFTFINEGNLYKYYDPTIRNSTYITYFGRGCIGKCSYCSGGQWAELYKNNNARCYKRRNRDVEEILEELKKLPDSIKHIWFVDEYFALNSKNAVYFFKEYKKYINKTFFTYLNYYYLLEHLDIFDLIIEAGLSGTGIGFQTGSESFAKIYYNRDNNNEKLIEYARKLFANNIYTGIHIIGGNCYETDDVLQDTIDLVRRLPYSIECPYQVNIENIRLRPHPKTPITYKFSRVITDPMPAKEWYYRAVLLEISRLLDDETLCKIRSMKFFHDNPSLLKDYYFQLLNEKQAEHYKNMIEIATKEDETWIFYCNGNIYKAQKNFFSLLKPKYFLMDREYINNTSSIDGIQIIETSDFFQKYYKKGDKFMIFYNESWRLKSKLHRIYKVDNCDIHSVSSETFYEGYLKS